LTNIFIRKSIIRF